MAVIQALFSFFAAEDDSIISITAGSLLRFVFANFGPLYLVAVAATGESEFE
ncbi:hypothetical protein HK405_015375, partial [Cladochytrium tenue]